MVKVLERISAWSGRLSLRVKLVGGFSAVIALTLLVGAVSLLSQDYARTAVETYFGTEDRIADLALKSNAIMLKARKYEKDFLLNVRELGYYEAKTRYATLVQAQMADIRQNMAAIRKLAAGRELTGETQKVEQTVSRYSAGFMRVVALYGVIGRQDSGLEGRFRDKAHEIEAIIKQYRDERLMADLLTLRRGEKDFLLRGQDRYAQEFDRGAKRFRTDIAQSGLPSAQKEKLARLVAGYRDLFEEYVRVKTRINYEMTAYLTEVHTIEPMLERLYAHASLTNEATRDRVRWLTRAAGWIIIIASLGATLAGLMVAFLISRGITRSVHECMNFAGRIARGDLGSRLAAGRGREFAALAAGLNDMADALRDTRLAQEQRAVELAESNEALRRSNRTHRMLSECNEALVHASGETELLDKTCRTIVEIGCHCLAWVGYGEREGAQEMYPVARAMHGGACPAASDNGCNGGEKGHCSIASELLSMDVVSEKVSLDRVYGVWLAERLPCGCASAIAFPLKGEGGVFGALNIHAGESTVFDAEEVKLLTELANDLSYGIMSLRSNVERQCAENALRQRQRAIESSSNGIVIAAANAPDYPITYVNPAFERITGYAGEDVLGQSGGFLLGNDREQLGLQELLAALREEREGNAVLRSHRKDGSLFWNELSISPVRDENGNVSHFVGIINDITERKLYEEQLEHQANHDGLTGLPNRNLLADRIGQALSYAERYRKLAAVLFVDLDHFKFINDSLGHDMGDHLLKIAGQRLTECVRSIDTVARYGGDEFVLVLPDLTESEDAAKVAQKMLDAVGQPFKIGEHEFIVSCSTGISIYPKDGEDAQTLLKNADVAMYRAKEHGRNNFQFYTSSLNDRTVARLAMEKHLRRALERNEFVLHYQPQVDLRTGRITGMESLIRWNSPELGFIPPDSFISLAEETGLIVPIGEWVIRTACAQNKAWQDAGLTPLVMAINLSPRQFRQDNLAEGIAAIVRDTGLEPRYLELEIIESLVMHDVDSALAILQKLKKLGAQLTMDDFGTGYSSLSYLKRFPFDKMKIDKSFVRDITSDPDSAAITRAIITMAHSLNLKVIAEGIETEGQLGYLRSQSCDEMQGFYFSRPVPAPEFEKLLRAKRQLEITTESGRTSEGKLLIVDDEAHVIAALERMLNDDGYDILTANSAMEGFELLATNRVGVIISDLRMPGMSGTEFLSRVKEIYPEIISIMLSGSADMESLSDAINRGAIFRFLVKPWEDDLLRESIMSAFRQYELLSVRDK